MMFALGPYRPDEAYPAWDITVELDGEAFRIVLTYRERQDRWYLDLYDADGTAILLGKMISVDTPILADYEIAGMPAGQLWCIDTTGSGVQCGYEDLGWRCLLIYVPEDEQPEAAADAYDVTIEVAP